MTQPPRGFIPPAYVPPVAVPEALATPQTAGAVEIATPAGMREEPGIAWSLLIPAAALVGYAIDLNAGTYDATGVLCIAIALGLGILAVVLAHWLWQPRWAAPVQVGLLGMAVAAHFALQLRSLAVPLPNLKIPPPAAPLHTWPEVVSWFLTFLLQYYSGLGLAAVCAGAVLSGRPFLGKATFPVLVVIFLGLGTWVLSNSKPSIDVYIFQQDSSAALLKGTNPYAITFRDPYGGRSPWYGPGLSVNGTLQFGYPYMPLTLLMTVPGYLLTGDSRFSQLAAIVMAALLIGYSRRTVVSFGAAVLYLFLSRTMLVLEEGWTEPFIVLLLAGVLFCAIRLPKVAPFVLGLFLVSKQYVPLCAPLALLLCEWPLRPKQVLDLGWKAALAAVVVTAPLVLWNFSAFWHSAVQVQMMAPFRPDALSLLAWVYGPPVKGAPPLVDPPSAMWAFVALGAIMLLCLWLAPRDHASAGAGASKGTGTDSGKDTDPGSVTGPGIASGRGIAGFCGAMTVSYLAFFFFNKQAFANYYFFAAGAMCCAIAAGSSLVIPPAPEK